MRNIGLQRSRAIQCSPSTTRLSLLPCTVLLDDGKVHLVGMLYRVEIVIQACWPGKAFSLGKRKEFVAIDHVHSHVCIGCLLNVVGKVRAVNLGRQKGSFLLHFFTDLRGARGANVLRLAPLRF
ncbi:hypothetical protein KC362_g99 [Hortaea werneckii]|nr:hypothetical protein KC362_g99 [Hortaea werneckii]